MTRVEKKLVLGSPATDLAFISTSLMERQNGTTRSRNRYLMRKTYAFAKAVSYLDDQCEVDKTFYNFCRKHRGPLSQRHHVVMSDPFLMRAEIFPSCLSFLTVMRWTYMRVVA